MGYDCLCDLLCDFEKKITFFKFKKLYCRFSSLLLWKILLRIFYLFILPKLYPMEHKLVKTTFDPFRTTKAASKIKTTSKMSLKLSRRINLLRRGTRTKLSTLDTAHNPTPSPPWPPPQTHTEPGKGHPQANKDP